MKTKKLYDEAPECFSFESEVVSCAPISPDTLSIELASTAFFPEAGGQSADIGRLGDFEVVDVQIHEDDRIIHLCRFNDQDTLPVPGTLLQGTIDHRRRLELMRQHTGEHMFSGLVYRTYGGHNVGFHLSDHICTMDYDNPLSDAQVESIETRVNELIQENRPIHAYYPDESDLEAMDYRCKGELKGPIRIVEIEGVDTCACCAPHVLNTGEVGLLKVLEAKSYKGGVRLTIVCGMKAFAELSRRARLLSEAAASLSSHFEDLPNRVQELKEERALLRGKNQQLQQQLLEASIAQIPASSRHALFFVEEADDKAVRETINHQMTLRDGCCGVFIGSDEAGYRFILGSAAIDLQKTASILREDYHAKCGGQKTMIQGQIPLSQRECEALFTSL
ncbi:MAG: alanyl-tRNA editing protein [Lachnospiraceae bacterium]|nr:alanyl-tRNA editing protein [Lachnospiraceae bacterium]